ncbi:hypothetical protein [uncultured Campylobacter sp.]|uniref:hypothetical protein n=1 Tax=uncultured Campylobacter sp. TaxID=218934 RepID=UPI0026317435|nr:hypothetical protein [uncultured Campylobacter sp.]
MLNEKDKKIIDDFLTEQGFDFSKYDDFIEYIQARGMLNKNIKLIDKLFFTKPNLKRLYQEFNNPIKRVCKQYKLSYKELSALIGYGEYSLKTIASTGAVRESLEKSLQLLMENMKLKEKLNEAAKINIS